MEVFIKKRSERGEMIPFATERIQRSGGDTIPIAIQETTRTCGALGKPLLKVSASQRDRSLTYLLPLPLVPRHYFY